MKTVKTKRKVKKSNIIAEMHEKDKVELSQHMKAFGGTNGGFWIAKYIREARGDYS